MNYLDPCRALIKVHFYGILTFLAMILNAAMSGLSNDYDLFDDLFMFDFTFVITWRQGRIPCCVIAYPV